jgi:hypothetical protein
VRLSYPVPCHAASGVSLPVERGPRALERTRPSLRPA